MKHRTVMMPLVGAGKPLPDFEPKSLSIPLGDNDAAFGSVHAEHTEKEK